MNRVSYRVGRTCTVLSMALFAVYTICFVIILLINDSFVWENLNGYILYTQQNSQFFKHTAMICMMLFGLSYTGGIVCLREAADRNRRVFMDLAVLFSLAFNMLISVNYFLQLTSLRLQIDAGITTGLEQLVQSNPTSAVASVNMLGWTWFLGASALMVALALLHSPLGKWLRCAAFCLSAAMLTGLFGFLFDLYWILAVIMNLGLGGTMLFFLLAQGRFLKDSYRQPR